MSLTLEEREKLKILATTKKRIVVIIRRRAKFFTSLRDFKKPENAGLVVFAPEQNRPLISEELAQHFDLIVFYNQDNNRFADVHTYDDVRIPDKDAFGDEVMEIIGDPSKVELLLTEETSIREICRLGERLGVKCPRPHEVMHLIKKELLLPQIEKSNISSAKSIQVDLSKPTTASCLEQRIFKCIGDYPVFIRPTDMAECSGTTIVRNLNGLKTWLKKNQGKNQVCLVEEYLKGREFVATVLLLEDGSFVPLVVRYLEFGWSNVLHIKTGHPLLIRMDSFENVQDELPRMKEYVTKVVKVLNPPRPHIFGVQGFQCTPKTDDYAFIEVSYRPAGGFNNFVCQKICGVCQESALLMTHLNPLYHPYIKPSKIPNSEIYMSFPCRQGLLEAYTPLPGTENVSSNIMAKWLKSEGSQLTKATVISDQMLYLTLQNEDNEKLLADARWIADNWRPDLK
ncbi:hypothetical protein L596_030809 [Steinernema carpocapsae]|uniref:ATP-grasp domain-containing protein n=1 Tax=Steinernema carpocapsae TaxID=34508 RepID=A0A4U5LNW8_STECR|nr:hypothetical protein L596_030809 [Steinernema carpocapsae]